MQLLYTLSQLFRSFDPSENPDMMKELFGDELVSSKWDSKGEIPTGEATNALEAGHMAHFRRRKDGL